MVGVVWLLLCSSRKVYAYLWACLNAKRTFLKRRPEISSSGGRRHWIRKAVGGEVAVSEMNMSKPIASCVWFEVKTRTNCRLSRCDSPQSAMGQMKSHKSRQLTVFSIYLNTHIHTEETWLATRTVTHALRQSHAPTECYTLRI